MSRTRVLHIYGRLNMGGPAHQAALLAGRRFHPERYQCRLVHGRLAAGEESLQGEAEREGAEMIYLDSLRQPLRPHADGSALANLTRMMRRFKPHVVHTNTAKAGMIGRAAAMLVPGVRPVIVHTYHGHVLEGYFGPAKSGAFKRIEAMLARRSDALVGVSQATVDDLIRLGVAEASRFRVVPLGLDLDRFNADDGGVRAHARRELGFGDDEVVCTFAGRIVPIKRVDLMLDAFATASADDRRLRLVIVGDGDLRPELESRARRLGVAEAVRFHGYEAELAPIWAASDLALLSSENEGTPVSLIEAAAAGVPAVATDVGGVRETVSSQGSILVPRGDAAGLGAGIRDLAANPQRRASAGDAARAHARDRFGAPQLIDRVDRLYQELLARRDGRGRE